MELKILHMLFVFMPVVKDSSVSSKESNWVIFVSLALG